MKNLGKNVMANIATKLWGMVSIYIFIPLYINILGETSYGLVSFFATLQTALNILGLGLSNTLRREFASGNNVVDNNIKKYKLLRSVENIYFGLGIIIMVICCLASNIIARKWLNIESLDPQIVAIVIALMGISIALQLIANLYSGCLFGLDDQVFANILCIVWSASKSIGALVIVVFIVPDLVAFYSWHILIDLIYLIALRIFVKKRLNLSFRVRWTFKDFSNMSSIWRYTCGILFISFIVLVNKQLDKVIISKYLTLSELGAYNVATTLGSLSVIVPTAIFTSVFPRFTNYATTGKQELLERQFLIINKIVGLVLSSMGAFIAIYSLPLIQIWTGSNSYVTILGIVGGIVVLAVTITEYQELPYALALANGNTKYNVLVGAVFIPLVFGATLYGIKQYGLIGAGVVYLLMMFAQTIMYEYFVYRAYLKINPIYLILKDMIFPLCICLVVACGSKKIIETFSTNPLLESIFAIVVGALVLLMLLLIFAKKEIVLLKKKKGR